MSNTTTLKSRMESINDSINNMIDEVVQDVTKTFKFSKFDNIDPKMCMYIAESVNLTKDSMKLCVELCAELDDMKESLEDIKRQNEQMRNELETYARINGDLLLEIKKDLKK